MTALVDFLAHSITQFDAFFVSANKFESLFIAKWKFSHHLLAESTLLETLFQVPLLTIETQVIRCSFALSAKVVMAIEASNSALRKVHKS